MTEIQGPAHKRDMTRRRLIVAGGAAVAAIGVGGAVVGTASAGQSSERKPSGAGEECYRLTSETTEGPYYIDADKIRRDITEDREGIPMTLRLKVIDTDTCKPLRGAAVDIWHCDALGIYSGYEDLSTGGGGGGGTSPSGAPTGTPSGTPTGRRRPAGPVAAVAGTRSPPTTSGICAARS